MTNIPYQGTGSTLLNTDFNVVIDKIQSGLDSINTLGLTVQNSASFLTGSFVLPSGNAVLQKSNLLLSAGSPFNYGVVIPMTARANISGGMWVSASGNLAVPGPALAGAPIGVAVSGTNVASGGTVNVMIHGIVAMVCEGTVVAGAPVQVGAGAGLNTVAPSAAGSGIKFAPLDAAASGTTTMVFVRL